MNTLEICTEAQFSTIQIIGNGTILGQHENVSIASVSLDQLPMDIQVLFTPFKIRPMIRFNGFLLDYWLASVDLFDHKIQLRISEKFYQEYKQKNIQGRIDSLSAEQKNVEHFWDKYVGTNNKHETLIDEIKRLITQ